MKAGVHFRQAQPGDVAVVSAVLSAAAARLAETGNTLWAPLDVNEPSVAPHVRDGLYHLALEGDEVVGVFRLQPEDLAFWPEIEAGTSTYLHKLAVAPHMQGRGLAHALLAHAAELTRAQGRRYLRLDCVAGRPRLRAVYESFGFRHHSAWQIGSTLFDRFEFDVGSPAAVSASPGQEPMQIRELLEADLDSLVALYKHLHTADTPPTDRNLLDETWSRALGMPGHHMYGGFVDGQLASSCTLTVVPNLTRGCQPFALIENVVTHASFRRRGFGRRLLAHACDVAWGLGCYKVMLMTGRHDEATHRFYAGAGFDGADKTAFVMRRPG